MFFVCRFGQLLQTKSALVPWSQFGTFSIGLPQLLQVIIIRLLGGFFFVLLNCLPVTDPTSNKHRYRSDEVENKQVTLSFLARIPNRLVSAYKGQTDDSQNEKQPRDPEVSVLVPDRDRKQLFGLLTHKTVILPPTITLERR
jgi:hypothetical protein